MHRVCFLPDTSSYLPNIILAIVKNGWLYKLCVKDTADVLGSVNQCQAPMAVQIDIKPNNTARTPRH